MSADLITPAPAVEPESVANARQILASPRLYDALTLQLAQGVVDWYTWSRDAEADDG